MDLVIIEPERTGKNMIKIIDDKGMLFGKINIIDFMVIFLLLFTILPMFYYGYKLYKMPKYQPSPSINWEQKYNEKIAEKEAVLKKYPKIRKYFK